MCAYRDALQIMPKPFISSRLYSRLLHSIWYHRLHLHNCLQQIIDDLWSRLLSYLLDLFELLLCVFLCLLLGLLVA